MQPKPARGLIAWVLKRTGFAGVTLPPFGVYLLPAAISNRRLVAHERQHWRQWIRMGAVMFYATYLWQIVRYGYENAPMEVEARAAENGVL